MGRLFVVLVAVAVSGCIHVASEPETSAREAERQRARQAQEERAAYYQAKADRGRIEAAESAKALDEERDRCPYPEHESVDRDGRPLKLSCDMRRIFAEHEKAQAVQEAERKIAITRDRDLEAEARKRCRWDNAPIYQRERDRSIETVRVYKERFAGFASSKAVCEPGTPPDVLAAADRIAARIRTP